MSYSTAPASHGPSKSTDKNFFAALFDINFTSFVTVRFLKVIYILLIAASVAYGLLLLVVGLIALADGQARGLLFIILGPVLGFFFLVLARVYVEGITLFFRIGENTQALAQALAGTQAASTTPSYAQSSQSTPSSYGQTPQADPYGQAPSSGSYGSSPSYGTQQPGSYGQGQQPGSYGQGQQGGSYGQGQQGGSYGQPPYPGA
jgi:hypothetical protein